MPDFSGSFTCQWPELFKFRRWNWINFDFCNVNVEYSWFGGKSFECVFILLGVGFYFQWYSQAWHEHAKALVHQMGLGNEDA